MVSRRLLQPKKVKVKRSLQKLSVLNFARALQYFSKGLAFFTGKLVFEILAPIHKILNQAFLVEISPNFGAEG